MAKQPVVFEIPGKAEAWEKNNWRKTADALNADVVSASGATSVAAIATTSASKVLVSSTDKVADYLGKKLIAGTGITLTESLTGGAGSKILTLASHASVTLAVGSASELTLSGQELKLAAVLTPTEHTAIGNDAPHHAAVTLATNHGLALTGQVLAMGTPSTLTNATTNAVTATTHTHAVTFPVAGGAEPALGNPGVDGYVLSSTMAGVRSWVAGTAAGFTTDFAIKMSGSKSVANTTTTKIDTFDTIVIDTNTEWVIGDLRWVCKTAGTYIISATLAWDANATGYRNIYIYVDGVSVQGRSDNNAGASISPNGSIVYKTALTVGQYVEIYGRQNSGGSLNAIAGTTPFEWQIWRIK
jgi:hypothetical protein